MEVNEILEQRQETYGDYFDVAKTSQFFKSECKKQSRWNELSFSQKESIDMIISKAARILNGDFKWLDSWYDIIGYSQLIVNQGQDSMDNHAVDIFGFIHGANVALTKNYYIMDDVLKMNMVSIVRNLIYCISYPNNIKPWKDIIRNAQEAIDYLEKQGVERTQH